ncbi:hypothetical protein T12_4144 [Trichinella patagoniensis]|uniref:Uncharacterized protein n=1 Tax=Trichinella patagoniensis TaxID=990121 RepID=A0A0V0ZVH0_9BILA|nr:hypothetical protein T12_4144 [Trichinella patagoniensis]
MVLNGTGLTIVLDTRQSSAVISDVIFNIYHSVLRPSSKAPTFDSPPARENGSWFRLLSYNKEIMATPGATPPAIFFQISKIFNFSNNLPQATPPASPQAIFEKKFRPWATPSAI